MTKALHENIWDGDTSLQSHADSANPHPNYSPGEASHPDLASHTTLGLASAADLDAHEVAADPHPDYALDADLTAHAGAADPHTGYQRESEKGLANGYASLDAGGAVPDSQIPSTIARDSELPDLAGHIAAPDPHSIYALDSDLTTHAGAADPHTGYLKENDANWTELIGAGETTLHSHAAGGHPDLATHDTLGLATQTELDNHLNDAADAHDASAISIADAGGDFTATDVEGALAELQADNEAHVAAADPHTGYLKENDANWTELTGAGETTLHSHAGGGGPAFPVGSVFLAVVSTNPATLLGYGTWAAFGAGRMLVGHDSGDADFDTAEETGGAKTHTLTEAEMPSHVHVEQNNSATTGGLAGWGARDTSTNTPVATGYSTQATGGGGAHNNMPPYIVVYMWKRTA